MRYFRNLIMSIMLKCARVSGWDRVVIFSDETKEWVEGVTFTSHEVYADAVANLNVIVKHSA